jgi:hypothetical protein
VAAVDLNPVVPPFKTAADEEWRCRECRGGSAAVNNRTIEDEQWERNIFKKEGE